RSCYHLVDEHAPRPVHDLRDMLAEYPTLGPVGDLLEDLEQLFPPQGARTVNKSQIKRPIIDYLLPEFAKYESDIFGWSLESLKRADPSGWRAALTTLVGWFAPLRDLQFRVRTIQRVRTDSDEFDVQLKDYRDGRGHVSQTVQAYQELKV